VPKGVHEEVACSLDNVTKSVNSCLTVLLAERPLK
jgi:hypothetical protein